MDSISFKSAWELAALIKTKDVSPLEVMEETLGRIEKRNPDLNAFAALCPETALSEARLMTERIASNKAVGPLAGIPMGVKDLEDAKGMVTSYGSIPFRNNTAVEDSVQVARLKRAGAIVVGKTNVPEFGFTGFTRNRLYGTTFNPWNLEKTPGGSSGGAAAAIAGRLVPICTGSDAGGSIRIPASYSGCFGFKPSFGRIPTGPAPYCSYSALTALGPLTRTVKDAAIYMDCTAGHHAADPYSLPAPGNSYLERLDEFPKRLKIAFSSTLGYAVVQKDVLACVENAVKVFEAMGHEIELWTGSLPDTGDVWASLIATDIYAQLESVSGKDREQIGRTLAGVVDGTGSMTVARLTKIQRLRGRLNSCLESFFNEFDLLLTPTTPTEAFAAGGPPPSEIDGTPIPLLGAVAFTYPFNFSGHPAASVPAGLTPAGLPVGLQIIGPRHRDDLVLQASRAYEKARPWDDQWPV